jgi:hypothetical protein
MERIIVPKGTKQNFETVFSDLQDYIAVNLKRRFDRLVASYGIEATVKNGSVVSDEFKVQQATSTTITIEPGHAITPSFNFLRSLSQTTISVDTLTSGVYTILAKASPYSDSPTAVVNGFLYSQTGGSSANTREHAGVTFEITASGTSATTSGVYLANMAWDGTSTATIYDRRIENIFLLKDSAIDDSNIVKKDRDSTITGNLDLVGSLKIKLDSSSGYFKFEDDAGTNLISFLKTKNYFKNKTGFGGQTSPAYEVDVSGDIRSTGQVMSDRFTSDSSADVLIQPKTAGGKIISKLYDDNGRGEFQDKDGNIICYFDKDSFYFNKPVSYNDLVTLSTLTITDTTTFPTADKIVLSGVSNSTFKIGVGVLNNGAGVEVLTEDPTPTTPINFRI